MAALSPAVASADARVGPVLQRLGALKFQVQLSSGYGETLIDYNPRQATIGAGVSFGDW
ncbi:MAG: phospholipase A [Betaproteobacteria bacterium]|nr:MAG: phospholipase A [Betaproteobacteria bacterium]